MMMQLTRSPAGVVAPLLAAAAVAFGAAAGSVCLDGPVAAEAPCPECDDGWLIRATEVDGQRHLVWVTDTTPPSLVTARQESNGTWTTQEIPGGPAPFFFFQMALERDLLAVGWGKKVDVFRLIEGAWTLETTLTSADPGFGRSVAVSAPGSGTERIVVGAPSPAFPQSEGMIYVYAHGNEWELEATIPPPPEATDSTIFGFRAAIDGDRLVVTSPNYGPAGVGEPGLFVYERLDEKWSLTASIVSPEWLPQALGASVAMRGDQIAARCEQTIFGQPAPAGVAVFRCLDGVWTFATIIYANGNSDSFAHDMTSLADEGDMLLAIANGSKYPSAEFATLTSAWYVRLREGVVLEKTALHVSGPSEVDVAALGVGLAKGMMPWIAVGTEAGLAAWPASLFSPAACPSIADLNHDGVVNSLDLGLLLAAWSTNNAAADLDGSGVVGSDDLGILLGDWSETP